MILIKLLNNLVKIKTNFVGYRNDCIDAYIDKPNFSAYDAIENDMEHLENIWGLYDEFNSGLIFKYF